MAKVDLSEFFKYSQPKKKPCPIGHALVQLDAGERAQLEGACAADKGLITAAAIRQWLLARKHDVTFAAVAAHRNGVCSCAREA